jgi:hypothetical protein
LRKVLTEGVHRGLDARFYALGAEGNDHPLPLDARGRLTSAILPGFALDPGILWRERLPRGAEVFALVEAMGGEAVS